MKSDKECENFFVGYHIGLKIKKILESCLGLAIAVCLWVIPLWIFSILGIGHS